MDFPESGFQTLGFACHGGAIIAALGIWQGTGHAVWVWVYWVIALVAFFLACFKAWDEQVKQAQTLKAELENPSKLVISQKADSGYYGHKTSEDGRFLIYFGIVISNHSNKPNSVVKYEVSIMKTDSSYVPLKLVQGETPNYPFCVTPVNIAAMSTAEAMIAFFEGAPQQYGQPFKIKIVAIDMHGKRFAADVQF